MNLVANTYEEIETVVISLNNILNGVFIFPAKVSTNQMDCFFKGVVTL
jgi:hypothetical protein